MSTKTKPQLNLECLADALAQKLRAGQKPQHPDATDERVDAQVKRKLILSPEDEGLRLFKMQSSKGYPSIIHKMGRERTIRCLLHRFVMYRTTGQHLPDGFEVDHINFEPMDCRRENLQLLSKEDNHSRRRLHQNGRIPGLRFRYYGRPRTWAVFQHPFKGRSRVGIKAFDLDEHKLSEFYVAVRAESIRLRKLPLSEEEKLRQLQDFAATMR